MVYIKGLLAQNRIPPKKPIQSKFHLISDFRTELFGKIVRMATLPWFIAPPVPDCVVCDIDCVRNSQKYNIEQSEFDNYLKNRYVLAHLLAQKIFDFFS